MASPVWFRGWNVTVLMMDETWHRRCVGAVGWWLSLLTCLFIAFPVRATDAGNTSADDLELRSPTVLRHYGEAEGLPQVSANALLRTHDGFLWVGTFGGLARFDGREFRVFGSDGGDDGPMSRRIVSLYEDAQRRLWIGTEDAGVSLYENGHFRQLPLCGGTCLVHRIFSGDGRDIWVLTENESIRIDSDSLRTTSYARASGNGAGASIGRQTLVGGLAGLARFSGTDLESVRLPDGHTWVASIASNGDAAWIIVDGGNLYRHDIASGRWTYVRGGLSGEARLLSDGVGGIYISDELDGTRRLGRDGGETPLTGLARMQAISLRADADGALWIGTPSKGLWLLRPSRVSLLRSVKVPDIPGRVVAPDGAGGVWIVLGCMSLWHLDANDRQTDWSIKPNVGEGCIHSLLHDAATGALWFGTSGGGLARLVDGRVERLVKWPHANQVGIWKTRDGSLWTASLRFVGRLRVSRDGAVEVVGQVPELAGMEVKRILDARAGGVWVVGDRGAFRVVGDAVVERWTSAQGLRGGFFRALYEDADGVLWIGSYGNGLIRIEGGVVRQYTEASGLFDDTVSCILPGADGRLWLAGNRGIGLLLNPKIGAEGPVMRTLATNDGLDPSELNGSTVPPCIDDGARHLWFAMMVGFARVTPATLHGWIGSHMPAPYIDRATVSQQALELLRPADLGVNATNLDIRYGAIDLLNPDKVRFRYRITGVAGGEDGWIEAGSDRSLMVPVLPWGRFTFEVQARELGGAWSPSATLRLNRPQPWYKYQWVWLAASLVSLLALLWATRERRGSDVDEALLARLRRPDVKP